MSTIPAPTLLLPREEWPDADFDLPDGAPLHAPSDKDDDEDWDMEMDLGKTGGAQATFPLSRPVAASQSSSAPTSTFVLRYSCLMTKTKTMKSTLVETIEEDFEDAFALPTDLTQLSLAPSSLSHRSSKTSLEWGDKENSSSSQSSDAYSSLGFADASPSSNSTSCPSLPDTETEEEEEELEGLVLPTALFESGHSARQLQKILEMKKKVPLTKIAVKASSQDADEDFEKGLVINDDVDLSPSRLVYNTQHKSLRPFNRSHSIPSQRPSALRPPSRAKLERSKSPANPPTSSAKQLQKLRLSPSPPLQPQTRSRNFQTLISSFPTPSASPTSGQNFLSPKPGSLRGQKSHSGLKPPTPPSSTRKLARKASMSSLIETSHAQVPGPSSIPDQSTKARYEEPTAASRAKTHKSSTSRMHDFKIPPTRPHTPSSNPAALRLTLPTQSRLKSRPALSQVFGGDGQILPNARAPSPLPPRPSSSASSRAALPPRSNQVSPVVPRLLRRPKRIRTYGDGTELDGIEDLPTDRDKEVRYRVQPKGYGNRIPGATFSSKSAGTEKAVDRGAVKKKSKRDSSTVHEPTIPPAPTTNALRRSGNRIEFPSPPPTSPESLPRKKRNSPSSSTTKRKPTLIRNLGGTNVPKVVGEMKWNPQTLRWEGNDQVLRDFDVAVGTSVRPALITHLTGSSAGSPMSSFASGPRVVGNMVFDPEKMCWISTLPPEEDEPDVFANLADDEDDSDAWETKGGTIRANVPRTTDTNSQSKSLNPRADSSSPSHSHSRTISESGSDRGSRASMVVGDVDDEFIESCRKAEERHRSEMKGWKTSLSKRDTSLASDRSYLFEIRALATRKY
ncbi:hypothetical protein CPB84DRAFT_1841418 [Gymnopilus junonius]|uniref:Protein byr4 n=1 Tax=Gymnopilus junonius TaxID=109634 RepID=A0A9P5TUJ9_GYMJU|nr:hypothetical protein CPB84DRAFT_1841418 [Gymnopilus junonius]